MADPTAARDRAIEAIADELAPFGGGTGEAEIAVDALLASPKLLRALAGVRCPRERPEIVTLCGSMRFFQHMLQLAAELTLDGAIVVAPFSVVAPDDQGSDRKARLDELHRRKIDMADRVVVVTDETGYYGTSTAAEIQYARDVRGLRVDVCEVRTPAVTAEADRG